MSARLLRYTQNSFVSLSTNFSHHLAADHSVSLYARNAVFSFIPKNGCTTLRYSAALDNQVISGPDQLDWVHENNTTFRPSLRELVTADYTFVVLRCPFRRLVSCFLHWILDDISTLEHLRELALAKRLRLSERMERWLNWPLRKVVASNPSLLDDLTFAEFVTLLESPGALTLNVHWRPQHDFLVYRTYDDFFCLEDMDHCAATVHAKTGFVVQDTRSVVNHGNHNRAQVDQGFCGHTEVRKLRKIKAAMQVPAYDQFYDADLYQRVSRLYRDDIELYSNQFGQSALLQLR